MEFERYLNSDVQTQVPRGVRVSHWPSSRLTNPTVVLVSSPVRWLSANKRLEKGSWFSGCSCFFSRKSATATSTFALTLTNFCPAHLLENLQGKR